MNVTIDQVNKLLTEICEKNDTARAKVLMQQVIDTCATEPENNAHQNSILDYMKFENDFMEKAREHYRGEGGLWHFMWGTSGDQYLYGAALAISFWLGVMAIMGSLGAVSFIPLITLLCLTAAVLIYDVVQGGNALYKLDDAIPTKTVSIRDLQSTFYDADAREVESEQATELPCLFRTKTIEALTKEFTTILLPPGTQRHNYKGGDVYLLPQNAQPQTEQTSISIGNGGNLATIDVVDGPLMPQSGGTRSTYGSFG